jgi:molybdenum cofactor guanylyltransferase
LFASPIPIENITLGLLAGGKASRLDGLDKAWLERDQVPQVLRWKRRFIDEAGSILVSANRRFDRYAAHGLTVVPDRKPDLGPLGGLDALAHACETPWLLTLPVDLVGVNECLLRTLVSIRSEHGAYAVDDDGPQPLVALWQRDTLRDACADAITACDYAVHRLVQRCGLPSSLFAGFRFGNLNTPEDLLAAGFVPHQVPTL